MTLMLQSFHFSKHLQWGGMGQMLASIGFVFQQHFMKVHLCVVCIQPLRLKLKSEIEINSYIWYKVPKSPCP
jgi:hypothetical protein